MIFNVTGGGGAALNFKVLAYATEADLQAATPAENTIGIITETPITSWIFSATEPSPAAAGMVWITVGTASTFEFNALKKNAIQIYPISAKQYVSGAWMDVTAMSYQGGEWVAWVSYIAINEEEWNKTLPYPGLSYSYGSYYFTDDALQGYVSGNLKAVTVVTKELVDFSDINHVKFLYDLSADLGTNGQLLAVISSSKTSANEEYIIGELLIKTAATNKAAVLDVSGITGSYYLWLGLAVWIDMGSVTFEISDLEFV